MVSLDVVPVIVIDVTATSDVIVTTLVVPIVAVSPVCGYVPPHDVHVDAVLQFPVAAAAQALAMAIPGKITASMISFTGSPSCLKMRGRLSPQESLY